MVTKDTQITDLLKEQPLAASILAGEGLHCVGCASVAGETIEQAAAEHGVDVVLLIRKLNMRLFGRPF